MQWLSQFFSASRFPTDVYVSMSDQDQAPDSDDHESPPEVSLPKIIKFSELARCGDEIWIEHAGQLYRLRRTRQDKLILTK